MMVGIPWGKPAQSTNNFKREPYHKWSSSPREGEKEEYTTEALKEEHHSPFSDDSLSPQIKKQISNDSLQGEF